VPRRWVHTIPIATVCPTTVRNHVSNVLIQRAVTERSAAIVRASEVAPAPTDTPAIVWARERGLGLDSHAGPLDTRARRRPGAFTPLRPQIGP
jgi:hypothetical protein